MQLSELLALEAVRSVSEASSKKPILARGSTMVFTEDGTNELYVW